MRKMGKIYFGLEDLPVKAEVFVALRRDGWRVFSKNRLDKPKYSSCWSAKIDIGYGEAFKFVVLGITEEEALRIYTEQKNARHFNNYKASWFGWGTALVQTGSGFELEEAWWVVDHYHFLVGNAGEWNEYNAVEFR